MRWIAAFLLLAALPAAPAAAQAVASGSYHIDGIDIDGTAYEDELTIRFESPAECTIEFDDGEELVRGICLAEGDHLAAAYATDGIATLLLLRIREDGALEGAWKIQDEPGTGRELLTLQEPGAPRAAPAQPGAPAPIGGLWRTMRGLLP